MGSPNRVFWIRWAVAADAAVVFFSGFFLSPAKPLVRIPAEIPGKEATLKTGSTISSPAWAQQTLKTRNCVHFPGLSLSPPARTRHCFNRMSLSLCWMNISSGDDNHVGTWTSGKGSSRSCQAQALLSSELLFWGDTFSISRCEAKCQPGFNPCPTHLGFGVVALDKSHPQGHSASMGRDGESTHKAAA